MKPPPKDLSLSPEQAEVYISELHQSTLDPSIATAIAKIIRSYMWLIWSLQETQLSLKRFRQMVFGSPANPPQKPCAQRDTTADEGPQSSLSSSDQTPLAPRPRRRGGHLAGQGRLGADAYVGAQQIACRHDELAMGERCPVCGLGRLYELPAGVEIRIDGHALLSATRYGLEKLRCSACGQVFTAALPAEAGVEKYSARAKAVLALGRYYLGLPFYRLQGYQAMLGVPIPDATQWDLIEHVGDCSYRVFKALETMAAQGELIHLGADFARKEQMSPEARLAYHQALSGPLLDELRTWLVKQVEDRLVEPNSSLGKAIAYLQDHWQSLTRFLQIEGAPLDNNLVERALKLFIRQRKNSLFYRTEHSAVCRQCAHLSDRHLCAWRYQRPGLPGGVAGKSPGGLCPSRAVVAMAVGQVSCLALSHPSPIARHLRSLRIAIPDEYAEFACAQGQTCVA